MGAYADKVVMITGAASGIGRAAAGLFARAGAAVVLLDRDAAAGESAAAALVAQGARAAFMPLDVRDPAACESVVAAVLERHGRLDAAFNNAGISGTTSLTENQGIEQWRQMIDINLSGVFHCMVPQLRAMRGRGGAIVNTASIAGTGGAAGAAAYSAAKHGVIGLTRTAAIEYARYGVRINSVSPGYIETPMTVGERSILTGNHLERALATVPARRLGHPEEVGEVVVWLCSEQASYVTGTNYVVDGGATAAAC
jgi:NAD(P)-dependent dehydrogenase (short-subunit alcohol dehydrogenase family)